MRTCRRGRLRPARDHRPLVDLLRPLRRTAEARLREHDDPVLAAADGYSYLHLVIVAGIIVFAVGMKATIHDLGEPLSDAARLALCGGIAIYLLGNAAFRLRMAGARSYAKLAGAAGLLAVFALAGDSRHSG